MKRNAIALLALFMLAVTALAPMASAADTDYETYPYYNPEDPLMTWLEEHAPDPDLDFDQARVDVITARPQQGGGGDSGCDSKMKLLGDTWSEQTSYSFAPPGGQVGTVHLTNRAVAIYLFCPNGREKPAKVKVKEIDWCWYITSSTSNSWDRMARYAYRGTDYNAKFYDSTGHASNPGAFRVPDDETRQNCKNQDIPLASERWLPMGNTPRWRASIKHIVEGAPDRNYDFKNAEGGLTNKLLPSNSILIKDWF